MKLSKKNALVTGATTGIGKEIALRLARLGANVAICGRNEERLVSVGKELSRFGTKVILKNGDLTQRGFAASFVEDSAQQLGGLDIVINNAGMSFTVPFENCSENDFDNVMALNVKVPFIVCKTALPYLLNSHSAEIINIASVTAHKGYIDQSLYSASKHALAGFTKSLAAEYYNKNIRVHLISPGGVYTDMVKLARPDLNPEGLISPSDVADVAEFMLTHRTNSVIDEIEMHRAGKQPFI
ncbi:MAG: 3-oxoacyl-ACP reductase [Clostridiales bacterium]|nr:MAG: 3-oxoacyl-ACP reductase [Clostridiales bacterium]